MKLDKMINQVIQGDCLEVMKQIPDKSIDLVVTDPPYGINIGSSVGRGSHLVKVGGEKLSIPKVIGGLMTASPRLLKCLKKYSE